MDTKKIVLISRNSDDEIKFYQGFGYELISKKIVNYKEINEVEYLFARDVSPRLEEELSELQKQYYHYDNNIEELYVFDSETFFLLLILCLVPGIIYAFLIMTLNYKIKKKNKGLMILKNHILEQARLLCEKEEIMKGSATQQNVNKQN